MKVGSAVLFTKISAQPDLKEQLNAAGNRRYAGETEQKPKEGRRPTIISEDGNRFAAL